VLAYIARTVGFSFCNPEVEINSVSLIKSVMSSEFANVGGCAFLT